MASMARERVLTAIGRNRLQTVIPHSRPWVGEEEAEAAAEVIRSGQLSQGPRCAELERMWCELTGTASAATVSSGLGALRLALHSLGVGQGDEVVMPAYSCVALLNATLALGATPVLADVIPGEWTLDPQDATYRVSHRTKAIIAVNLFGMPTRIAELRTLGPPIIEDCAHGIAGWMRGDLSIGSFYATKMHGAGEGGIVTGAPELIERVRRARDYGDQAPNAQHLNDKMSDIEAAVAVVQLKRRKEALKLRAERAARYDEALEGLVELPARHPDRVWYRYVVRVQRAEEVCEWMKARGVCVEQPVWDLGDWADGLPVSQDAFRHLVSLPLYPDLTDEEQTTVIDRLAQCLREDSRTQALAVPT